MKIDTSSFREKYRVDEEVKFGHYKSGNCIVCGKLTTQCDAYMLWDGIPTYLCSDKCHEQFWGVYPDPVEEKSTYAELSDEDKRINDLCGVTPEMTGLKIPPNGVMSECKRFPCAECEYYYGEINECMYEEVKFDEVN